MYKYVKTSFSGNSFSCTTKIGSIAFLISREFFSFPRYHLRFFIICQAGNSFSEMQ